MKIPRKIRFYEKFVRDGNGCWIWESATQGEYGCFTEGPRLLVSANKLIGCLGSCTMGQSLMTCASATSAT
jgi:hypothetical protein